MTEDSANPIAQLEAEISRLRNDIGERDRLLDQAIAQRIQLATKELQLVIGRAAPQVYAPHAERDNNIAAQQTINNYTLVESRRPLDDYLTALSDLAVWTRRQAQAEPQPAPSTDMQAEIELRRIFAQALLSWQHVPVPAGATPADDYLRRRLIATLLLPLISDSRIMMRYRYDWALGRLSSTYITVLVLSVGVQLRVHDAESEEQARRRLIAQLADARYAAGCTRLLEDLVDPERGLPEVAFAYEQLAPERRTYIPHGLLFLATGGIGGGKTGSLISWLIAELRTPPAPAAPAPEATPRAAQPTPGLLRIPVTPAEWRFELGRRNKQFGAPDGYWCYVRPGSYRVGGWKKGEEEANLRLGAFWIARVPFTVAQYAQFMRAGGYRTRRWWTPNGWEWRPKGGTTDEPGEREQPYNWRAHPHNSRAEQALYHISWYEATACCAWLAEELRFDLPAGYTLRLPSEAEWEAAAAYGPRGERFRYPWGYQEPTAKLAVFDRNWDEGAPDVGTCPAGAAACGALDLAGTIWDVCSSSYKAYPRGAAILEKDFTTSEWDVPYRGGAYYSSSSYVRCGARYWAPPGLRINLDGFRVVVSPPLARLS